MKKLYKRMYEVFMFEIVSSLLFSEIASAITIGDSRRFLILLSSFALALNLVWSVFRLRRYRFKVAGKNVYYKTNFAVFGMLAVFAVLLSLIKPISSVYIYLFLPFQLFWFAGVITSKTVSAIIVSLILFACVYVVPFTVHKGKRPSNHNDNTNNEK